MSHNTIIAMTPFDDKCQNIQMFPHFFALAPTVLDIKKLTNFTFKKYVTVTNPDDDGDSTTRVNE